MATNRAELIVENLDQEISKRKAAGQPIPELQVREEDWLAVREHYQALGVQEGFEPTSFRGYPVSFADLDGDDVVGFLD